MSFWLLKLTADAMLTNVIARSEMVHIAGTIFVLSDAVEVGPNSRYEICIPMVLIAGLAK